MELAGPTFHASYFQLGKGVARGLVALRWGAFRRDVSTGRANGSAASTKVGRDMQAMLRE